MEDNESGVTAQDAAEFFCKQFDIPVGDINEVMVAGEPVYAIRVTFKSGREELVIQVGDRH